MPARTGVALALLAALAAAPTPAADDATATALRAITRVTREGKGNEDAGPAWKALVARGGPALLPTLEAFEDGNPAAANWLRTAADAIADAERAAGRPLPADKLEAFATNPKFAAAARRQAYELLVSQVPGAKARLLPTFLNDRSPELRRDAIAHELERLERDGKAAPRADLEKLFAATRDKDQVELLAKKVKESGGTASTAAHFGFVTAVQLVGPFDGPESKGFGVAYPPETATAATGAYAGKDDAKLKWVPAATADRDGRFDLNNLLGKHKNAVAYALATVAAEKETPCEVRVTSPTSVKIFLNQTELFGRDEYHHGAPFDGHTGRGTLRKGENVIVVKVCQNNQSETWAQKWEFQVRVCDATGGPLAGVAQLAADGKALPLGFLAEPPAEDKK
ncbi:Uncharacterized protein OS=Planctomyces brasiliensis (strain ATCC 49424 / DSM 5305 / JCM 21570 / NBRC 103401 / IFAM 1448) GN=Plabr_2442 PE=4 SV=1 [Gemmataceae bacterium]|nr:Uncharacterized protein OS=Planctomyces brasiliensis (strain ATCC 49424 / DSM 5305 / JCM 21570 / NBRC 103401 / IFAM 1448) GN=Plabr_2442 PE=4 SV=1 [Gemmataceae bacterium]VTT97741.1 Uncharacterized protein OS=Planctomyces brasiliensis (strain ATCC 49424 / DSM 5305 / JCM 21570 / NBRC 103401 / IFAM 1448) GN=Plabr_2442 PE=4 SV=1 [Gemmataceae bacterium]